MTYRYLLITFIILTIFGCSEGGNNAHSSFQPSRTSPINNTQLPLLEPNLWIRRAALDTLGQLPAPEDVREFGQQEASALSLIKTYSQSISHAKHYARLHQNMWNLRSDAFADFQRFINEGDLPLAASLTESMQAEITADVTHLIEHNMNHDLSYNDLFSNQFTSGSLDLLDFWSYNPTAPLQFGKSTYYALYEDNRPKAGILSNQGFLSHFDSRREDIPYTRTYQILNTLTCSDHSHVDAHNFYSLTDATQFESLRDFSITQRACRGCHVQYHFSSHLFAGLASGETFGEFSRYNQIPHNVMTQYIGKPITQLRELSSLIAVNPATQRCHIQKTVEELFQRPYMPSVDANIINKVHSAFTRSDFRLKAITSAITHENAYRLAPFHSKTDSRLARTFSGIKFLNAHHWYGIIEQLGFNPADFEIVEHLNLSATEPQGHKSYYPTAEYWNATQRIAQQLAAKIVEEELQGPPYSNRYLFSELPEVFNLGITTNDLKQQIHSLVYFFTSRDESQNAALVRSLVRLWTNLNNQQTSAAAHRRAWTITLQALLLSHEFMTY